MQYVHVPTGPGTGVDVGFDAKLAGPPLGPDDPPGPDSWFITSPLGNPAAGTFTEVEFEPGGDDAVLDAITREVASLLYGHVWAAVYPPAGFADTISRHGMRRRERVRVERVEVLS